MARALDQAIVPHTQLEGRRFARSSTSANAPGANNASSLIPAGMPAALATTLPRHARLPTNPTLELKRAHTPLRLSQLERELVNHPDKAWSSWLLEALHTGVRVGYTGPRQARVSRNLHSASQNPSVIDEQLQQELLQQRIMGPFSTPPLEDLQCSNSSFH